MLKQRVVTAAVTLPVALFTLVYAPSTVILSVFCVFVALCSYETAQMLVPKLETIFRGKDSNSRWVVFASVAFACSIFIGSAMGIEGGERGFIFFGVLGSILIGSFFSSTNDLAFARIAALLISVCYGCFPWLATWDLYLMGPGGRYTMLLLAVVWCGDTGAYFGGRHFGKRKLAPRMSPNKTWEGAIAGLLSSLIAGSVVHLVYGAQLGSWSTILIASFFGGLFGQMGDLVESTLKRFVGVKDSGVIFPGHGGFLDRVDGLMFAAPVMCFILFIVQ